MYKLVLTGGPCGGKTTGQSKLATFFESIGWKVRISIHIRDYISFAKLTNQ